MDMSVLLPLHPLLIRILQDRFRVLDIFLCRMCGIDILDCLDNDRVKRKVKRKLQLFYDEASNDERMYILRLFPNMVQGDMSASKEFNPLGLSYQSNRIAIHPLSPENQFLKLSSAYMWTKQNKYYEKAEISAWEKVPFEISSNCTVANLYCKLIESMVTTYMEKHQNSSSSSKCLSVCVLEIASGHGILSYLLAKKFMRQSSTEHVDVSYRVVGTDFHDKNFKQLLNLPWIKEICTSGYLDFAVLKADVSSHAIPEIPLLFKRCNLASLRPDLVVVVGNYAMDSFPVDMIVKTSGDLCDLSIGVMEHTKCLILRQKRRKSCGGDEINPPPRKLISDEEPVIHRYACCPIGSYCEDTVEGRILSCSDFGLGVHIIPQAGFGLMKVIFTVLKILLYVYALMFIFMKMIKRLFTSTTDYGLIVGDYFISSQSKTWQVGENILILNCDNN